MEQIVESLLARYDAAENYLVNKRDLWDEYENLFHNILTGAIDDETKSRMFDPVLSTMAIERSNRVMAQMPTGKVRAMSKNDEGASKLMNLTLDKYIFPNAKSQFDFLTKMRLIERSTARTEAPEASAICSLDQPREIIASTSSWCRVRSASTSLPRAPGVSGRFAAGGVGVGCVDSDRSIAASNCSGDPSCCFSTNSARSIPMAFAPAAARG